MPKKAIKSEKMVFYVPRDEVFADFHAYFDMIDCTSANNKSGLLRHLVYRGWQEFKASTPVDPNMASLLINKPPNNPKEQQETTETDDEIEEIAGLGV